VRSSRVPALLVCAGLVLAGSAVASTSAQASATSSAVVQTSSEPLLREGSRGPAVRDWQRVLDRAVVAGVVEARRVPADGVFGPLTRTVTMALQARAGLRQDGVVGQRTRDAVAGLLDAAPAGERALREGLRGQDVRDWQRALDRAIVAGEVRHPRLRADGVFGPATRTATQAVQRRLGQRPDGIVTAQTRDGLAGLLDG
jgi:murein L,D-transpeptidase YcbB/YkuD